MQTQLLHIQDNITTFVAITTETVFMDQDLINEINKEILIQAIKQWIRTYYPVALAESLCSQIDDAKHFAKWIEAISKSR